MEFVEQNTMYHGGPINTWKSWKYLLAWALVEVCFNYLKQLYFVNRRIPQRAFSIDNRGPQATFQDDDWPRAQDNSENTSIRRTHTYGETRGCTACLGLPVVLQKLKVDPERVLRLLKITSL